MKLSKSKLALAKVINENGGWRDDSGGEFAAQCTDGIISFWCSKPSKSKGEEWCGYGYTGFQYEIKNLPMMKNWHQTCLSREEYHQAYPKADDDGWIEWNGGACPVEIGSIVDVKQRDGDFGTHLHAGKATYEPESDGDATAEDWSHNGSGGDIIAYRLHKPEVKPEFCESVTRSIPEPESIDELCAKVTSENKHQRVDAKPTIEQLASDYRNKLDFANRKQQEADEAKADVEAKLKELELACEAIGLLVSPIIAKQEHELVAAVKVGDEVECVESNIKRDKYNGMVGRLHTIDESDTSTPYLVDFGGNEKIWCHKVKFIRRP